MPLGCLSLFVRGNLIKILWAAKVNNAPIIDRIKWFIGNCRDIGEDMGVLGGRSPPNTPIFLPHSGDFQRADLIKWSSPGVGTLGINGI